MQVSTNKFLFTFPADPCTVLPPHHLTKFMLFSEKASEMLLKKQQITVMFLPCSLVSCFEVYSTKRNCFNLAVNLKHDKSTPNKHKHEIADN